MALKNTRAVLASRPRGRASENDFRIETVDLNSPGEGEVLLKNLWVSVDPYMRGRMDATKSYTKGLEVGDVMVARTIAEVLESRHPDYRPGDLVTADGNWQSHLLSRGQGLRRIDPSLVSEMIPLTWHLGILGMPGTTAWIGMMHIGAPKAGETAVVSAASGAVGMTAVQLAKLAGLRVVGIAGGPDKCAWVERELGADACIDYKAPDWTERLAAATPKGVDVYFDNVGGPILDEVLDRVNFFARIPLCGLISRYDTGERQPLRNVHQILINRVMMQGFIVFDRPELVERAVAALHDHARAGRLRYRESISDGLESAPRAMLGLLEGRNFGKQLVRV